MLGTINWLFCQWFGFRICKIENTAYLVAIQSWGVVFPVTPLTGWNGHTYWPKTLVVLRLTPWRAL